MIGEAEPIITSPGIGPMAARRQAASDSCGLVRTPPPSSPRRGCIAERRYKLELWHRRGNRRAPFEA
jgi:hypothetical protein